jgi:soluble lytic murein transglycosylase-like protein
MPAKARTARRCSGGGRRPCVWMTAALATGLVFVLAFAVSTSRAAEPVSEPPTFASRYAAIDAPPDAVKGQEAPPNAAASVDRNDSRASYRALIAKEAAQQGLAPEIAEAVMAVESGFNPGAIGGAGEIGLMQILPSTARMLGFTGSLSDLAIPENNIHFGVTYLAQAWRRAGGDLCTAVMKYRAGHGETRFSYLSVNYCVAVRGKLFARGYPVTGSVPVATFGEAAGGLARGCGRRCLGGGTHIGTVNIAALNTRLTAIVAQARGGR